MRNIRRRGIRRTLHRRWKLILITAGGLLVLAVGITLAVPQLRDRAENWLNHTFHAEELAASEAYERTRGRDALPAILTWAGDTPALPDGYTIYAVSHDATSGTTYLNVDAPDGTTFVLARQPISAADNLHLALPVNAPRETVQFSRDDLMISATLIQGDWALEGGWQPDAPVRRLRWEYDGWRCELTVYAALNVDAVIALVIGMGE